MMRIGIALDYSGGFHEAVDRVVELEKTGIDIAVVAEAYAFDAISQLGYLAAKTKSVELATGVVPIYIRTPSLLAMTAAGLDYVSGGRFHLGIGTSGPQVIEGFHGLEFDAPLGRTRETVEICRQVWRRERVQYDGKHYQIPLPAGRGTGLGKALHLINHPVRERIPISIAALGPKNVELTAEIAEGWQPAFYYPDKAGSVWGAALAAGAAKRDPALGPLDVMVGTSLVWLPSASAGKTSESLLEEARSNEPYRPYRSVWLSPIGVEKSACSVVARLARRTSEAMPLNIRSPMSSGVKSRLL